MNRSRLRRFTVLELRDAPVLDITVLVKHEVDRHSRRWELTVNVYTCTTGDLAPELYRSGALAMEMGVQSGPKMTPECAVVKTMLCLAYPDLHLTAPLAGEL